MDVPVQPTTELFADEFLSMKAGMSTEVGGPDETGAAGGVTGSGLGGGGGGGGGGAAVSSAVALSGRFAATVTSFSKEMKAS